MSKRFDGRSAAMPLHAAYISIAIPILQNLPCERLKKKISLLHGYTHKLKQRSTIKKRNATTYKDGKRCTQQHSEVLTRVSSPESSR
jgi:hypothetical protein